MKLMVFVIFSISLIPLLLCSCSTRDVDSSQDSPLLPPPENREHVDKWEGTSAPEELSALALKTDAELRDFLNNLEEEPCLRVEAVRLLVERTRDKCELFPVFLLSLRSPTKREREAALYYLSRFGIPEHIPAIEASAEGMDEHFEYSIKCTINQINERAQEGKK